MPDYDEELLDFGHRVGADPRSIDAMEAACQRDTCGHRWIDHEAVGSFFMCKLCGCGDFRTGSERERLLCPDDPVLQAQARKLRSSYPQRWHFDEGMREISGFGGGYEQACRVLLLVGGEWADQHVAQAKAITSQFRVPKEMEAAMLAACPDCSGAMFGVCLSHIVWVMNHTWGEWVERMRADLRRELAGGTGIDHG